MTTVKLNGSEYELREKPRLREVRDVSVESTKARPEDVSEREGFYIDQAAAVVAIGLRREYPTVTVEYILDSNASPRELFLARNTVLEYMGMIETKKVEAAASTGDGSTDVSAQV